MKRARVIGLCVGAVALGIVGGLLFATSGRPVTGKVVDKAYEDEATTAELVVLVGPNEYEKVRGLAHELVGCYVSRSKPVYYPECRR